MPKITLFVLFILFSTGFAHANLSKGIQLIASGNKQEGVNLLEKYFENANNSEQARIALILSRVETIKMENTSTYYAKYALKFLRPNLTRDEVSILNVELADYHLMIGSLDIARKYYLLALNKKNNKELNSYVHYRLAWVSYNNDKLKVTEQHILKSLKFANKDQIPDTLYLLGKISGNLGTNLSQYLNKDILQSESFLRGVSEGEVYISLKGISDRYTRLFYSVHGKVKDSCGVLYSRLGALPERLAITNEKLRSYLNGCLVQNPHKSKPIQKFIFSYNTGNEFSNVLALTYLMEGNKSKSCEMYKGLFEKDNSAYKGLVSSCRLEELNLKKIVDIKTACGDANMFNEVNSVVTNSISAFPSINNQALLFAVMKSNLHSTNFLDLNKKLLDCPLQKDILAKYFLNNDEKLLGRGGDSFYSNTCMENTQSMLLARYKKYLLGGIKPSDKNILCLKNNLNKKSKEKILATIDFKVIKIGGCHFDFDCTVQGIAKFVNNVEIMNIKPIRPYKKLFNKLKKLETTKLIVRKGISIRNIESVYNRIKSIKRVFIKPSFFNGSLMSKASSEYNQLIENVVGALEGMKGIKDGQRKLLSTSLLNEKVVL